MADKKEEANKNSARIDFLFKKMSMLSSELSYMILPVLSNPELFSVVHSSKDREIGSEELLNEIFDEIKNSKSQAIVLFFTPEGNVGIRNIGGTYTQADGTVHTNIVNYANAWSLMETGLQHLVYSTYMTGTKIREAFIHKNAKLEYRKGSEESIKQTIINIVSYWDSIIAAADSTDNDPIGMLAKALGIDTPPPVDKSKMN